MWTRTSSGIRTSSPIDFGISSSPQSIIEQEVLKHWPISDHIPVLITIVGELPKQCPVVTLDRHLLSVPDIAREIINHEYPLDAEGLNSALQSRLRDLGVIKSVVPDMKTPFVPSRIRRAINRKRHLACLVSKAEISPEALVEASHCLNALIRKHRRAMYLKYVGRGITFLRNNDSSNAWRWIKSHIGSSMRSPSAGAVYAPQSTKAVTNPTDTLAIWAEHFRLLCVKGVYL
ncbi:hypothetical protein PAEPH01_2365 [Pancytospora epiphaga]|nr:hypothetical protein PAEPH01_2365 [Pancytospora epiphaga]